MNHIAGKRRCHRFDIPGGEGRYKKNGLLGFTRGFSKPSPVCNVSKGGLSILCEETFDRGEKVMVQLLVPDENPLNLISWVRRLEQWSGSGFNALSVEFMPFGNQRGMNPLEALDSLRRLESQYGNECTDQ
ncbi:MAG: PilZ domain-containing protein [Deltaproteobacteria bacterium]|nr:PilZ domain-containing protein [Deltaproteobacteria bacterium]